MGDWCEINGGVTWENVGLGQILAKSYYCYEELKCKKSVNEQLLSGDTEKFNAVFSVDGYTGSGTPSFNINAKEKKS